MQKRAVPSATGVPVATLSVVGVDEADGCTVGTCSPSGALYEVLLHTERRRYVCGDSVAGATWGTLVGKQAQEHGFASGATGFEDDACHGRR